MIKVRKDGKTVDFTGKDYKVLMTESKNLGLTPQQFFSGIMWEHFMREARNGVFKKAKKGQKA